MNNPPSAKGSAVISKWVPLNNNIKYIGKGFYVSNFVEE